MTLLAIGDFGYYAFGKSRIAYGFTGFMLLANNIILIGFHVLTGAKVLNTLSDHSQCTVVFSVIVMLMGIVMSLLLSTPRMDTLSDWTLRRGAPQIFFWWGTLGAKQVSTQGDG
jgi:hypothetical protein